MKASSNSTFETTEEETVALCDLANNVLMGLFAWVLADRTRPKEVPLPEPEEPEEKDEPSDTLAQNLSAPPVENPERRAARIERGRGRFCALVSAWREGFGEGPSAAQPDRVSLLREVSTGPVAGDILEFVSSVGGIIRATDLAVPPEEGLPEAERRNLVNLVASNITQVSSIVFPDLSAQYEYRNIYLQDS